MASGLDDQAVGPVKQVISVLSRRPNEVFVITTTEANINVYQVDYTTGAKYTVSISLIKRMKLKGDCICASFEEPQFFVATQNRVAKVLIDPNPGPKCLVSK